MTSFSPPSSHNMPALYEMWQNNTLKEDSLFEDARNVRMQVTGSKIFLYGFIYLSTYCHNGCTFCLFSHENTKLERYRKKIDEVLAIAQKLADDGVHLIDLTMGEDPYFLAEKGFHEFLEMIHQVKTSTGLAVMVSPGVLPKPYYPLLREAGADWYACYQENHSHQEFSRLRPMQDFETRDNARKYAHEAGLLVEDGLLTGTGESMESLIMSMQVFQKAHLSQARIMTYVGYDNTIPMQALAHNTELTAIALLRLANPEYLIPASLDIGGINGLESRLQAGANVVTSIIPDGFGLSGVVSQQDIENKQRNVIAVKKCLQKLDLVMASTSDYQNFIANARKRLFLASEGV